MAGAFSVGDVELKHGDEMGWFEFAGSTTVLLVNSSVCGGIVINDFFAPAINGEAEVRV